MSGDPEDPFLESGPPPHGARALMGRLGLALAIAGSLASVLVPDGWPADIAMGLALVGFVMLLVAGR